MEGLRVDPNSHVPPSAQLVAGVLDAIASGVLNPGEKLPSVRGAAVQALVNPNTVSKARRELEGLGVVRGKNGSGVFVTDEGPDIARRERGGATLDALRESVAQALRSGHDDAAILVAVKDALRPRTPQQTQTSTNGTQGRRSLR